MRNLKYRNLILALFICSMTLGCATLQQPLPGSLWGEWSFIRTGTIINGSNERLENYRNLCYKEGDRLRFSSDNKISLNLYDESCAIHHYSIGQYHVEGNTLKVDLATRRSRHDNPLPPITDFRIIQINATTLKIEEIPNEYRRQKHQGKPSGPEVLVFIFMRLD